MSVANLNTADEVYCGGQRIARIYTGGALAWQRRIRVPDLYGTGVGQIPLDLRPEDAVLDASGNVVRVLNRGGAGAYFDATASGAGITIDNGRFSVPTTTRWLGLANRANLIGVRLFICAAVTIDPLPTSGSMNFAGTFDGSDISEGRNNVRWDWGLNRFQLIRYSWDGTTGTNVSVLANGPALTAAETLHEFEFTGSRLRVFRDAGQVADVACTWPSFVINRIFAGQSTPAFTGLARGVRSLIIGDGTTDLSAQIATIRASYGR